MEQVKQSSNTVHKTPELTESLKLVQLLDDLRLATMRGSLEGVKSSLQKGIAVNQTLKGGWSPLMYASSMGHPDIVQYLLQEGANPNFHKELFTSLMAACASTRECEEKLVRCVELLIQHGADANAVERHRISALMFAAKEGHQKLVAKLADPKSHCDLNLQDSQGWTALFWAVNQGKEKVVSILVQQGAKLKVKDRRGQTALDLAQSKGLEDIAAILNNQTIPNKVIKIPDIENIDDLCRPTMKKKREFLFEALLDELMNAENNNSRYGKNGSTCLASLDFDNKLEGFTEGNQISLVDKQCFQNNWLNVDKCSQLFIRNGTQKKPMEIHSKNVVYSIIEAEQVLSHAVRHLSTIVASISYVRLRVQAHPLTLLEDKNARIAELNTITEKAIHHTLLLHDELKFLHQYGKKLEESDKVVPADLLIEQKEHNYSGKLMTMAVITMAVTVMIFNNRFKISMFISGIH